MYQLYFEKLVANIPKDFLTAFNPKSDVRYVYSAMHGVGYRFVEEALKIANLKPLLPVKEQRDADPEFPTVKFPNPEEGKSSLLLSFKHAEETSCKQILANDPDADRLALAEFDEKLVSILVNSIITLHLINTFSFSAEQWKVFTGNEIGALLGWWALHCYQSEHPDGNLNDCFMLASTVSSKMLRAMARIEGFNFVETLTGFKWMGRLDHAYMSNKHRLFTFILFHRQQILRAT